MYSHVLKVDLKLWRQIVKTQINDMGLSQYLFHVKLKKFFLFTFLIQVHTLDVRDLFIFTLIEIYFPES